MTDLNKISVIVPAWNEALTLRELVHRIDKSLRENTIAYEIIIVDDKSVDQTAKIAHELSLNYPVVYKLNTNIKGKAYSIIEGAAVAKYDHLIMIDADLQYPPEAIVKLIKNYQKNSVVVGNRIKNHPNAIRRYGSMINRFIVGKLLLGLSCDVQSGLKLFHKEVLERLDLTLIAPWALDMPLLVTARELGQDIVNVDISFDKRKKGKSKIDFLQAGFQLLFSALKIKLKAGKVHYIKPSDQTMTGAGVYHNYKKYITHTTLHHKNSALKTFTIHHHLVIWGIMLLTLISLIIAPINTLIAIISVLSVIYFIDVFFNFYLISKSLNHPPEIISTEEELRAIKNAELPVYSILCPLYKEAQILPQFIKAMSAIDWPKDKLDVLLLLEEDDKETLAAVDVINIPSFFRILVVPDSMPKTKPKACNYGLNKAKGEFIVIYDAEDIPDPLQLKKAYLSFKKSPKNVFCLQSKLNYYNRKHNLLTKLFTAEYSLWFDIILPGLQSINTIIPLGGTSNHFRTTDLQKLEGWDPFNVAEDCDLGTRLFKRGYLTAIIDSTTMEEANSNFPNWLRQRSRWIKGYIQTFFVHSRKPLQFFRQHNKHALIFQLVVGGKIAFMLINPILWLATFSYFALYAFVGPFIESLYPTVVFYIAVFSLVFGNFLYLYYYMIGSAKRGHFELIKYTFLVPLYWLFVSIGAGIALIQLIYKPHYWEKTVHGYHLQSTVTPKKNFENSLRWIKQLNINSIIIKIKNKRAFDNGLLVFSNILGNFLNFLYNAYLGRKLTLEEFGLLSLIGNFIYLAYIPIGAISNTVTHRSAYLLGKYEAPVKIFWSSVRRKIFRFSALFAVIWLILTPFLKGFFKSETILPFLLFTPVWTIGMLGAVDSGFLNGNLKFSNIALLSLLEAATKFLISFILISLGLKDWVYLAIPFSLVLSFFLAWTSVLRLKEKQVVVFAKESLTKFPVKYFSTSILLKLTAVAFLSFDLILAKHYLTPIEAGQYAFISLVGKMIFFIGSLFSVFMVPYISKTEGAGKDSQGIFYKLLLITTISSTLGYVIFGLFGFVTVPFLWGAKSQSAVLFLPLYGVAMVFFAVSSDIVAYHQSKKQYLFPLAGFFAALVEFFGIVLFHNTVLSITYVFLFTSVFYFVLVFTLHIFYQTLIDIHHNTLDFFDLFSQLPKQKKIERGKLRILIFNWRDKKHVWAGGAEEYIHEIGKRWVQKGHDVLIFCGNDGHCLRHETIDGIKIIRRGGFYFVYIWAFLYYIFRLRNNYDVIIDSENGIPFFTPLYSIKKKFLLIHHVHQEVFRKSLRPPLSWIATFLELKVMPFVYRRTKIITVSPSSKTEILLHELTKSDPTIIYNGVDLTKYQKGIKNLRPLVLYIGRLKFYKSLNVFIQAAKLLSDKISDIEFVIGGSGEEKDKLQNLAKTLGLGNNLKFLGRVSEEEKISLFQKAWVFVNPSLMEGWGITTIEANACGTPVVASNVPGLRDSIHNPHNGFLVPYGNVEEFAKSIEVIIKNRGLREKMSRESIEWAQKFDWEKSANEAIVYLKKN